MSVKYHVRRLWRCRTCRSQNGRPLDTVNLGPSLTARLPLIAFLHETWLSSATNCLRPSYIISAFLSLILCAVAASSVDAASEKNSTNPICLSAERVGKREWK